VIVSNFNIIFGFYGHFCINTEKYHVGREGRRNSIETALINLHKEGSYIPHKDSKIYQTRSIMPLCHGSEGIQFLVRFLDYCYCFLLPFVSCTQGIDRASLVPLSVICSCFGFCTLLSMHAQWFLIYRDMLIGEGGIYIVRTKFEN